MSLALASASVDVVVVGAGVAGLAASGCLRCAGRSVLMLEAGARIGGRAWTDRPAVLGGVAFDHGAQWLHDAAHNPLVPLARDAGEAVHADISWDDRALIIEAPGETHHLAAYQAAEKVWHKTVTARLEGPDCSLAEAGDPVADNPWTATIETWEGAIIAAADADELSLRDWARNELDGENFVPPGGLGAMLCRLLGAQAGEIRLGVRVTGVRATARGVRVSTDQGKVTAKAVIVTVSTGVLRDEAITFEPALPPDILGALDGLPMGLLSKIVLRAEGPGRLGLSPGTDAFRRVRQRGAPGLSTIFWPGASDIAIGFIGGRAAWDLEGKLGEAAAFMRGELGALFGPEAGRVFGETALLTNWGNDPLFRGAYAFARPGHAGARAALGVPVWEGRLAFAGEACVTDGKAGTVAGAYQSGERAAQNFLARFPHTAGSV